MRLIDADELKKQIVGMTIVNNYPTNKANALCDLIDAQPTAYDADKVVEKLEEEREISYADFDRYVKDYGLWLDAEYDDFFHKGLERAARIVKRGGADESERVFETGGVS